MLERLFWDCGTQCDLLDPDGAAPLSGADAIRPALAALTRRTRELGVPRLLTRACFDSADATCCRANTPGQDSSPETRAERATAIPPKVRSRRGVVESVALYHDEVVLDTPDFDPWSHAQLGAILDVLAPRAVVLYGLPAELSVAPAAQGLLGRGVTVTIVDDALAARDEEHWARAKKHLASDVRFRNHEEL